LLVAFGGVFYLVRKRREEAAANRSRKPSHVVVTRARPARQADRRSDVRASVKAEILVEEKRPVDIGVQRTTNLGAAAAVAAAPAPAPGLPSRHASQSRSTTRCRVSLHRILEAGDPLAEADFHMAYGLYDQAADLVQLAIRREPDRRDLRLKLLEIYFVWGNRDRFVEVAREMNTSRAAAEPGEWDKVLIMGKQIAPDDPLFSTAIAGAGALDLDLQDTGADMDLISRGRRPPVCPISISPAGVRRSPMDSGSTSCSTSHSVAAAIAIRSRPTVETLPPTVESLAPTVESLAPTVEALTPTDRVTRADDRIRVAQGAQQGGSSEDSTEEVDLESLGLDIELPSELEDDKADDLSPTVNRRPQEDTIEQPIKRSPAKPAKAPFEDDIASMTNIMRGGTGRCLRFNCRRLADRARLVGVDG
jgi:hypothetical protein